MLKQGSIITNIKILKVKRRKYLWYFMARLYWYKWMSYFSFNGFFSPEIDASNWNEIRIKHSCFLKHIDMNVPLMIEAHSSRQGNNKFKGIMRERERERYKHTCQCSYAFLGKQNIIFRIVLSVLKLNTRAIMLSPNTNSRNNILHASTVISRRS